MQLDPVINLTSQLRGIPGNRLEAFTAATCASIGYTVFRGLFYELGGERAAEADVFASIFTPLRESRILFECKGGHPTFNDIRKFASLAALMGVEPDELLIICKQGCPRNRIELAHHLKVRVVERTNLAYYVLPLIGGHSQRSLRASRLNRYLAWQTVHEFFNSNIGSNTRLQQHYRFLVSELWAIQDPQSQIERSFDAYLTNFPNTCDFVARERGTTAKKALYNALDDIVETAMYVELLHRLLNVYAIVRRTIEIIRHFSPRVLISSIGYNLRNAIASLSAQPRYFVGFPSFLQTYFFVWGGFIYKPHRQNEIELMAFETGTTAEAVELYLNVLDRIYKGVGRSMFTTWGNIHFFKYIPAAFRALGMQHRKALDPAKYSSLNFFNTVDTAYESALDRALNRIGGIAGLRF